VLKERYVKFMNETVVVARDITDSNWVNRNPIADQTSAFEEALTEQGLSDIEALIDKCKNHD
jgi:hypothetical protein